MTCTQTTQHKRRSQLLIAPLMILAAMLTTGSIAQASPTEAGGFLVESCHEDFEDVDFCNDKAIEEYNDALKYRDINFNHRFILHFFFNDDDYGFKEVVAIDPETKKVYLTNIQIRHVGEPIFSKNKDTFCFEGAIQGYRQDSEGEVYCYQLAEDKHSPFGADFVRVSLPY